MTKTTVSILTVLAVVLFSGCAAAPVMLTGLSIGGVAVNETTGKSITDHTVSAVNRKDCRVGRAFKGQEVCQEKNQIKLEITTTGVAPSAIADIEARYR
jgi:starvation-inducible outer membrane lipoprotein